jgi:uncharacterized membrane protein
MASQNLFETEDHTLEFDTQDTKDAKVWSILAYVWILFFLPLVCTPQSRFGKFHANQGLVLFLTELVLMVVMRVLSALLGWIPVVGTLINLLGLLVGIAVIVWAVYGIVQAAQGKAKTLPLIGKLTLIK